MWKSLRIMVTVVSIVSGCSKALGEDLGPFEMRNIDGIETLWLVGTKKQQAKVATSEVHIIMDSIAKGWDVNIGYTDIDGDLLIENIADKLEKDENGKWIIKGKVSIFCSNISGYVSFDSAKFSEKAFFDSTYFNFVSFTYTQFSEDAYFISTLFSKVVYFRFAQFGGVAYFRSAGFSDGADFWSVQFNEYADFCSAKFGFAEFESAKFDGNVFFGFTQFNGDADFRDAQFNWNVDFRSALFSKDVYFRDTQFSISVGFSDVLMERPANFANVRFRENTLFAGIWNATLGRVERFEVPVTDFYNLNPEIIIDGSSNPWLKRYIEDEQWIHSWRMRPKCRWLREFLFTAWELTSHCGRSFGLWMFWSAVVAIVFGLIYRAFGSNSITFDVEALKERKPGLKEYIYYSVVTFTTLGFGDIVPLNNRARLAVGVEVVMGYVMLGGLISIFANIFARRS